MVSILAFCGFKSKDLKSSRPQQARLNGLRAPFSLGDVPALRSLFSQASLPNLAITTHPGVARFPSIQAWVYTETKGWVLADMLDEAQFEHLLKEAKEVFAPFVTPQGTVSFSAPAHIVTVTKL